MEIWVPVIYWGQFLTPSSVRNQGAGLEGGFEWRCRCISESSANPMASSHLRRSFTEAPRQGKGSDLIHRQIPGHVLSPGKRHNLLLATGSPGEGVSCVSKRCKRHSQLLERLPATRAWVLMQGFWESQSEHCEGNLIRQ